MKFFLQKESTRAAIVLLALLALAILVQKSSHRFINKAATELLLPLQAADSIQTAIINRLLTDSTPKISTLKQQYLITQKVKGYYQAVGTEYYTNYYAFSICAIIFMVLLTVAVFMVANKGWQNTPVLIRVFLLGTVVLSSLYYFLPNVLNNKENIRNNLDKVKLYQTLETDMLSFSNTIGRQPVEAIDSTITNNYKRISNNLDFLTTIDDSKLGNEVSSLLKGYQPSK